MTMPKIDWSNEVAVRNAFVEAVLAGDDLLAAHAGTVLVSESFDGAFSWPDEVESGVLLTEARLPEDPESVPYDSPGVELLDGLLPPKRFEVIMEGDELDADDELPLWRKAAAENILGSTELDWDVYSMWSVRPSQHEDGREAYLADMGGGYSFTKPGPGTRAMGRPSMRPSRC